MEDLGEAISRQLDLCADEELSKIASSAMTSVCLIDADHQAPRFIESTLGLAGGYLDVKWTHLKLFRDRVSKEMKDIMRTFLKSTFQWELRQLIEASTQNQSESQAALIREMFEIFKSAADESKLTFLKNRIELSLKNNQDSAAGNNDVKDSADGRKAQYDPEKQAKETMFARASLKGDIEVIKRLTVPPIAIDINAAHQGGWTALMNAALHGHTAIVKHLIGLNAQLDIQDLHGFTALHYAASYSRMDVVRALVAGGSSITIKDNAGRMLSDYVTSGKNGPKIKAAIDQGLKQLRSETEKLKRDKARREEAEKIKQTVLAQASLAANRSGFGLPVLPRAPCLAPSFVPSTPFLPRPHRRRHRRQRPHPYRQDIWAGHGEGYGGAQGYNPIQPPLPPNSPYANPYASNELYAVKQ